MRHAIVLTLLLPACAAADCHLELELLAHDLKGVKLTEAQKFALNPHIEDAQKRCRVQREAASLAAIERARKVAGIERHDEDDEPAPPPVRQTR